MKVYLSAVIAASVLFVGANSYAAVVDGVDVGDVLTGDTKLAREATLCLAGALLNKSELADRMAPSATPIIRS